MMGQQRRAESLFYYFRLEEQIPTDHLLRLIDRYVDFSFVREQLKDFTVPCCGASMLLGRASRRSPRGNLC
jgi:transposase